MDNSEHAEDRQWQQDDGTSLAAWKVCWAAGIGICRVLPARQRLHGSVPQDQPAELQLGKASNPPQVPSSHVLVRVQRLPCSWSMGCRSALPGEPDARTPAWRRQLSRITRSRRSSHNHLWHGSPWPWGAQTQSGAAPCQRTSLPVGLPASRQTRSMGQRQASLAPPALQPAGGAARESMQMAGPQPSAHA